MAEKSELKTLYPDVEVTARGETISIKPFKTKEWLAASKIVGDLQPLIARHTDGESINMMGLMIDAGDSLIELIALGIRKPVAWIEEASLDETVKLAKVVFELNREDFAKKVMPLLGNLLPAAKEKAAQAAAVGSDSSKS